jgi:thiol-disulfide isomerase/thioredoxin
MRATLSFLFVLGASSFANADDEKKTLTLKEKVAEIQKELEVAGKEIGKKAREAKTDEERRALHTEFMVISRRAGEKILTAVKAMPNDAFAFDATLQALQSEYPGATDYFIANFVDDERVLEFVMPQLIPWGEGEKLLNALAEKSKSKEVKGIARFVLVKEEVEGTEQPIDGKALPERVVAAKMAAALVKLDAVVKEFAEVNLPAKRGSIQTIAEAGKDLKFFVKHLIVGKVAPDAECELLEQGKKSSLKDYRGKVVVLDIWATWCGPCKAMIPHQKEMVKHFEGKPFMLLSISVDEKKETLTKFLEKEVMPWTHWWAGTENKSIKNYQVKSYPTIYVLDGKGVIRAKRLRGDELQKFVEQLIEDEAKNKN